MRKVNQELFSIIQSLCRIGLGGENQAYRRQVERLRGALAQEGFKQEAAAVEKLLKASSRSSAMQPSRVTISPAFAGVETLSRETSVPVDRETGAPLAEIIYPEEGSSDFPILEPRLLEATQSIISEWRHHEMLRSAGVQPPSTCLLYGIPGTGKTRIALAMSAQLGLPIVLARLDGVISSFLGTTGRNVANLFSFANRYNCVLLLDEFDAIAKVRDDPHEVGEIKRVVNAILQNIDMRRSRGITIAITNHELLLDSAVWRRFDIRIEIPPPGLQEREQIALRYFTPAQLNEVTARFVAWLTEGLTGADIEVMAKNVRRFRTVNPQMSLIECLRRYSITQAGKSNLRHQRILSLSVQEIAKEMSSAHELSFTQKQIGELFGISQTQVGRWIKEGSSI